MAQVTLEIEPLEATFGATVTGVSLRSLDDETFAAIRRAWLTHALLIFPDQHLTREEQDRFAARFGPLEFRASPISNIRRDGTVLSDTDHDTIKSIRGNEGWHMDSTYMPVQALGAVFSAEILPPSGSTTGWADLRAAYDALAPETRELVQDLRAHHSLYYSQERAGYLPTRNAEGGYDQYGYHQLDVPLRPLVKVHPETGRPNLVIGRHAHDIIGWDRGQSEQFLDGLVEAACRPPRVHHHRWSVGDAVLWDNRCLLHRATPYDLTEPRRMWHTRIAGDPVTEAALNHAAV
ncbi:MAG: TauD/TfdA family dioxygenase [Actinomycetota bacterium]